MAAEGTDQTLICDGALALFTWTRILRCSTISNVRMVTLKMSFEISLAVAGKAAVSARQDVSVRMHTVAVLLKGNVRAEPCIALAAMMA